MGDAAAVVVEELTVDRFVELDLALPDDREARRRSSDVGVLLESVAPDIAATINPIRRLAEASEPRAGGDGSAEPLDAPGRS